MKRLAFALITAALAACSQKPAEPKIRVDDVWARSVAQGQTSGAIYMTIVNDGDAPDRLVSAKGSLSATSELHNSDMSGGMASMKPVAGLDVPAHGKVALAPGGTHIMMTGLTVPLTAGDRFFVDLTFEKTGHTTVSGKVVDAASR